MKELVFTIIGGVIVTVITSLLGLNGSRTTTIQGIRVRKTGKWIIIFSVIMIISGLAWAGSSTNIADHSRLYGYTLAGYGLLAFIIGKIIAWFQKI